MLECKISDYAMFCVLFHTGYFGSISCGKAFCREFRIPLVDHAFSYLSECQNIEVLDSLVMEHILNN